MDCPLTRGSHRVLQSEERGRNLSSLELCRGRREISVVENRSLASKVNKADHHDFTNRNTRQCQIII